MKPLLRKRAYIRLAEGFDDRGQGMINAEAIGRTLGALEGFKVTIQKYKVKNVFIIAAGVMRRALNREDFLDLIQSRTGLNVKVVTGDEEARLTGIGVLWALNIESDSFIIFDLGGGTTEFLLCYDGQVTIKSLPLGAVILKQKRMPSDPPSEKEIAEASNAVEAILGQNLHRNGLQKGAPLIGTGGTVTTLAAIIYGIETDDIDPGRMNGLVLEKQPLDSLFRRIKETTIREKLGMIGLDQGRADVIAAGSVAVKGIMDFFRFSELKVCLSDILEGVLVANTKDLDFGKNELLRRFRDSFQADPVSGI